MSNSPSGGWRNWGDHPFVIIISLIVAFIAIAGFLTGKSKLQDFFSKANDINPLAWSHVQTALNHLSQRNYEGAVFESTQAIELDPDYDNAYNTRGLGYAGLGNYDSAILDYNQAIRYSSNVSAYYQNRAIAYIGKKEFNIAMPDINRAIEIEPENAHLYKIRGEIYAENKQIDAAISDFRQCSELSINIPTRNLCDNLELTLLKVRLENP